MAKKHQTVLREGQLLTRGQLKDLGGVLLQAIPDDLSREVAQYLIGHKKQLASKVREVVLSINPYADIIAGWQKFYRGIGIDDCDFSGLEVQGDVSVAGPVIAVAKDITPLKAVQLCDKFFSFACRDWITSDHGRFSWDNLDREVKSERTTEKGHYATRLKNKIKPSGSEKYLHLDATLEEWLMYLLKYYMEKGRVLRYPNKTVVCKHSTCCGSHITYAATFWYPSYDQLTITSHKIGGYSIS